MFQVLPYFFKRILTYCNLKDDGVEWLLTVKKEADGSGSRRLKKAAVGSGSRQLKKAAVGSGSRQRQLAI